MEHGLGADLLTLLLFPRGFGRRFGAKGSSDLRRNV
jgi:hypothetical protein